MFAGGHGLFLGLINDFVHMVMYFYYFLTSYNPDYRKKIWWKKYLTQLQMVNIVFVSVVKQTTRPSIHVFFTCRRSSWQ